MPVEASETLLGVSIEKPASSVHGEEEDLDLEEEDAGSILTPIHASIFDLGRPNASV